MNRRNLQSLGGQIILLFLILLHFQPIWLVKTLPVSYLDNSADSHPFPFDGFYLDYTLDVKISGNGTFRVDMTVEYLRKQNTSSVNVYEVNLTVSSIFLLYYGTPYETGYFDENGTDRRILTVNLNDTNLLALLYLIYFNQDVPNWSPWWNFPSNFSENENIQSYNLTLAVTGHNSVWFRYLEETRSVWRCEYSVNTSGVTHDLVFLYDEKTGMLMKANMYSVWYRGEESKVYSTAIEIRESNGFAKYPEPISNISYGLFIPTLFHREKTWILTLVSFVPFLATVIHFLRIRRFPA